MKKRTVAILCLVLTALLTLGACSSAGNLLDDTTDIATLDKSTEVADNKSGNDNESANEPTIDISEVITEETEKTAEESTDKKNINAEVNTESEKKEVDQADKAQNKIDNDEPITGGVITSAIYAYLSPEELQTKAELILVCEYTGESSETLPDESFINGAFMHREVYTDYIFKPLSIIKGTASEELTIRCPGGTVNGQLYTDRNTPNFETGKKYLVYLKERNRLSADDKLSYYIITTSCFEVDNSGKLSFKGMKQEDKTKIQALCDTALEEIKPEAEKAVQNNATE